MKFGTRLKKYLEDRRMSPEAFAVRIQQRAGGANVAGYSVDRWTKCKGEPQRMLKPLIADEMGVPESELFPVTQKAR